MQLVVLELWVGRLLMMVMVVVVRFWHVVVFLIRGYNRRKTTDSNVNRIDFDGFVVVSSSGRIMIMRTMLPARRKIWLLLLMIRLMVLRIFVRETCHRFFFVCPPRVQLFRQVRRTALSMT